MSYQNKILVSIGYPDYHAMVRDKLGLDSNTLPDEKIDSMMGVELAEKLIIKRLTAANLNYATILAGDDALYLKMATIFCIATLFAGDFGQGTLRSEKIADYQYEAFQTDMKKKEKGLWEKVDENLCNITGYTVDKKLIERIEAHTEVTDPSSGTSSPY